MIMTRNKKNKIIGERGKKSCIAKRGKRTDVLFKR